MQTEVVLEVKRRTKEGIGEGLGEKTQKLREKSDRNCGES